MIIGDRLRELRQEKNMSQGDVEQRTGLLRCYISRVENGHTVPSVETLEKFARALEVPMYRLFYDGKATPKPFPAKVKSEEPKDVPEMKKLRIFLSKMTDRDRSLLLHTVQNMARKNRSAA